ncbi:uncharacterized protein C2845_PM15G25700 [Panicum miliaceum]|uniref:Uncharacterized protein n=1 Tax=Panicum miliaceum TaxID=4540 RepID=A0A3L6Q6I1_PANMI|nr:uncharacterized protein C2845_PM15G25700 [Panicum miliaceum]
MWSQPSLEHPYMKQPSASRRGGKAGAMSAPSAPPRTVIRGRRAGYIMKLEPLVQPPIRAPRRCLRHSAGDLPWRLQRPRPRTPRHIFLYDNHDLVFAACVGVPPPPPDGSPFLATWDEYRSAQLPSVLVRGTAWRRGRRHASGGGGGVRTHENCGWWCHGGMKRTERPERELGVVVARSSAGQP